jgi:hypothetical protein
MITKIKLLKEYLNIPINTILLVEDQMNNGDFKVSHPTSLYYILIPKKICSIVN